MSNHASPSTNEPASQLAQAIAAAHAAFERRDFGAAEAAYRQAFALAPNNLEIEFNIGVSMIQAGKTQQAITYLQTLEKKAPHLPQIHDGLAKVFGQLGDREQAAHYGRKSLDLKDQIATANHQPFPTSFRPLPPPPTEAAPNHVISFSLWGKNPQYLNNAIRNAIMARELFPEWRCRFYCEKSSVPSWVIAELIIHSADVVLMPPQSAPYEGLFWRFLPVSDPQVERFLIRDADSVLNYRERMAVSAWLQSDKHFHLMRDWYTHTDLILAGMWGGVGGILPPLTEQIQSYLTSSHSTKNCDQRFLGEHYWVPIKSSVLIHDSWFGNFSAVDFPAHSELDSNRHVGGCPPLVRQFRGGQVLTGTAFSTEIQAPSPPPSHIFSLSTGFCGLSELTELLRANIPGGQVRYRSETEQGQEKHLVNAFHLATFNTEGNTLPLAQTWFQVFHAMKTTMLDPSAPLIDLSHHLVMAGLIENLAQLVPQTTIHLIHLEDQLEAVVTRIERVLNHAPGLIGWSVLSPSFTKCQIDPIPFREHGNLGLAVWHVLEMKQRIESYRKQLSTADTIQIHSFRREALQTPQGAQQLFQQLNLPHLPSIHFPPPSSSLASLSPDEKRRQRIKQLVALARPARSVEG